MKKNKKIAISKFQDMDNCYILTSAKWQHESNEFCLPIISFFYDNGNYGAEWCPPYGAIQVWNKASQSNIDIEEHYFYDYIFKDSIGQWSQCGVDENELPKSYVNGFYNHIFEVLKKYANR